MKTIFMKLLLLFSLTFWAYTFAWAINFEDAGNATEKIKEISIHEKSWNMTMQQQIEVITMNIFKTVKIIIWGLLVIYLVYAWVMMILSMWDDEQKLSESKRSIRYAIIGLLFINIPTTLYTAFFGGSKWLEVWVLGNGSFTSNNLSNNSYRMNIFINTQQFWSTLWSILTFLQITIVALAIFMIVFAGIKIIMASGDEEKVTESKNKILWSLAGLIFIWVMEVWRNVMFRWDFKWQWQDLFSTLANLALFFAGPIAIFFLSLAGYYYITAGGDEDKVKKAKSIVFNTLIATLILIGMYTLLLDLKTLSF